ncbi:glycosyltransferase family 9 protein [Marinicella sp. W31]|uniref:glycosyltransferase family 9 protein n=1 Tax=Marinicella sp. W31 TaxID=3023713 RepID=UPI003757D0AA
MKILVIQQKMIGDVLISSILCQLLKQDQPDATIHYLVNSNTTDVVKNNPWIDKIIEFVPEYKKSKRQFWRFTRSIRATQYDAVVDVYSKPESNLISLLSGAKQRISYHKWYSRWIYTETHKRLSSHESKRAYYNRLKLIAPLLQQTALEPIPARIYITEQEQVIAADFLSKQGINDQQGKPIMLNILGSHRNKSYPPAYMAELIENIASYTAAPMLMNYMPGQEKEVNAVIDLCQPQTRERLHLKTVVPSLRSFLALLTQCGALIGNEGGAIHMAQALNVPSFAVFSPWVPKNEWQLQLNDQHQAIHLSDINPQLFTDKSVDQLKKAVDDLYQQFEPHLFIKQLHAFLQRLSDDT